MAETFNRNNFHKNTFCIFTPKELGEIENLSLGYKSQSGSRYYFTESGVYRLSNHWGRAAGCKWRLQPGGKSASRTQLGFALWTAFHRDNEFEKLYYIERNPEGVHFQHKDSGNHNGEILRSASQTTSRIRQIRHLLENDSWTKYYSKASGELTQHVVAQLIDTDKTLQQIKSELA